MLLASACTSNPIVMPGSLPALTKASETRAAILDGMAVRGWVLEEEGNKQLVARVTVRSHVAKTRIDYSGKNITFSYAGSENLNCRQKGDSCKSIHRKYNYWVDNLSVDIHGALMKRR